MFHFSAKYVAAKSTAWIQPLGMYDAGISLHATYRVPWSSLRVNRDVVMSFVLGGGGKRKRERPCLRPISIFVKHNVEFCYSY